MELALLLVFAWLCGTGCFTSEGANAGSWRVDGTMSCLHWQGYFQKKKTCQRVEVEVCHWIALKNEGCRSPGSLQLRSSAAFFLATFFGLLSVLLCFLRLILQQFTLPVNLSLMLNYIPVLSALFSLSRLEPVQLRDPEWATY